MNDGQPLPFGPPEDDEHSEASSGDGHKHGDGHHHEEQWDVLALRFLDGDNSHEIRRLLPDPEFRKLLAAYSVDSAHLLEFCGWIESCLPSKLNPTSDLNSASDIPLPAEQPCRSLASERTIPTKSPVARFMVFGAAATAIAATLLLALWIFDQSVRNAGHVTVDLGSNLRLCAVETIVGDVHIGGERASESASLGPGQSISTSGALSSVRLIFADDTAVQLGGDTSARVHTTDGQKLVCLDYGHAAASVRPQPPGKPLMLHTSTAELEVAGTEFAVSVESDATKLSVSKGVVLMKPHGGGEAVAVRDGEFSEVRLAKILPPYQTVSTPDSWREDFDEGLPEGWAKGVWVAEGADASIGGAVSAARSTASEGGRTGDNSDSDFYTALSQDQWANGLMRVEEDSQLTYRIKMDRPEWYQVFLCVRAEPVQDGEWSWNYEYQEGASVSWRDVEPGVWRQVTVPLKKFKRQISGPPREYYDPFELRTGAPPPVGGLVVKIMFTSQSEDRGMVIDDICLAPAASDDDLPADPRSKDSG